jgi:predicted glycosyltransferase
VHVHPFSTDYAAWLQGAAFSISHAGYNTTTALLRARVPALVVPNPRVSDQVLRAARLEAAGLAAVIEGGESPAPAPLAEAMGRLLSAPRPCHDLDFDGVAATRRFVEASRTQPSI